MASFKLNSRLAWRIAALFVAFFSSAAARGQFPNYNPNPVGIPSGYQNLLNNTIRRPTVSPYLNLLLPGNLPGTNYQTLVRPALEQQRINRDQELQLNRLQQQFSTALQSSTTRQRQEQGIRPTGHQAAFFHYSHYYFNQPRPSR
jgi:hypothetical protein